MTVTFLIAGLFVGLLVAACATGLVIMWRDIRTERRRERIRQRMRDLFESGA